MAPDNEWLHLLLARAHIEAGELDAAIADSERALEINPRRAMPSFARAADRARLTTLLQAAGLPG